jgi:hypothetical protein
MREYMIILCLFFAINLSYSYEFGALLAGLLVREAHETGT